MYSAWLGGLLLFQVLVEAMKAAVGKLGEAKAVLAAGGGGGRGRGSTLEKILEAGKKGGPLSGICGRLGDLGGKAMLGLHFIKHKKKLDIFRIFNSLITGHAPDLKYSCLFFTIGIDAKYDVAVTTACGLLDYIVVKTSAQAQACVEYLRAHNLGKT